MKNPKKAEAGFPNKLKGRNDMFDNKERFIIENYNRQSTFASFLPDLELLRKQRTGDLQLWCRKQGPFHHGILSGASGLSDDKNHGLSYFFKGRWSVL